MKHGSVEPGFVNRDMEIRSGPEILNLKSCFRGWDLKWILIIIPKTNVKTSCFELTTIDGMAMEWDDKGCCQITAFFLFSVLNLYSNA